MIDRTSLRLSAALLSVGQLLYIVVTQLHPGIAETATNHADVFSVYAGDGTWIAVHAAQFLSLAIFVSGLLTLFVALDLQDRGARLAGRLGAVAAVAALALYAGVQAVDGVANKHADVAWANAPAADKAARFASAEVIRWLEWGMRSYHDYTLGFALLLIGAAVALTDRLPHAIGYVMALSGVAYLLQGWVVGVEGFSGTESIGIVLGWVLTLAWVIGLARVALRPHASGSPSPADEGLPRPAAA